MGRTLRFLGLGLSLCLTPLTTIAAGLPRPAVDFPLPVDSYHDQNPVDPRKTHGADSAEKAGFSRCISFSEPGANVHCRSGVYVASIICQTGNFVNGALFAAWLLP
jgi:hypothetical protein